MDPRRHGKAREKQMGNAVKAAARLVGARCPVPAQVAGEAGGSQADRPGTAAAAAAGGGETENRVLDVEEQAQDFEAGGGAEDRAMEGRGSGEPGNEGIGGAEEGLGAGNCGGSRMEEKTAADSEAALAVEKRAEEDRTEEEEEEGAEMDGIDAMRKGKTFASGAEEEEEGGEGGAVGALLLATGRRVEETNQGVEDEQVPTPSPATAAEVAGQGPIQQQQWQEEVSEEEKNGADGAVGRDGGVPRAERRSSTGEKMARAFGRALVTAGKMGVTAAVATVTYMVTKTTAPDVAGVGQDGGEGSSRSKGEEGGGNGGNSGEEGAGSGSEGGGGGGSDGEEGDLDEEEERRQEQWIREWTWYEQQEVERRRIEGEWVDVCRRGNEWVRWRADNGGLVGVVVEEDRAEMEAEEGRGAEQGQRKQQGGEEDGQKELQGGSARLAQQQQKQQQEGGREQGEWEQGEEQEVRVDGKQPEEEEEEQQQQQGEKAGTDLRAGTRQRARMGRAPTGEKKTSRELAALGTDVIISSRTRSGRRAAEEDVARKAPNHETTGRVEQIGKGRGSSQRNNSNNNDNNNNDNDNETAKPNELTRGVKAGVAA